MANEPTTETEPLRAADEMARADGGDPSTRQPRDWSKLTLWLAAATLLLLVAGAWHYRWMTDDGFIHLRIVKQIEAGHGPVFNAGERVEASTSPAWTWMLVLADVLLPLRLEWIAVLGGIGLTVAGVAMAMLGAAELVPEQRRGVALVPAGALVLAVLPSMWLNASTGLENGLVFAWLGACFWTVSRWSRTSARLSSPSAVLLGVGVLVRPELLLVSLCVLAVPVGVEMRARHLGAVTRLCVAAFAVPLAYQVFRMGYYASLTPNSALAKEAGRSFWNAGWTYFHQTVDPYWLWVPFLFVLVGGYLPLGRPLVRDGRRRSLAVVLAFPIAGLLSALFVTRVGGDFYHARLLLPAIFAVFAPVAVVPWRREYTPALLVLPWAAIAIVALRSPLDRPELWTGQRNPVSINDYGIIIGGAPPKWFDGHGTYVVFDKLRSEPLEQRDPAIAEYAVGAVGYAVGPDVYIQDFLGLGDALGARLQLDRRGELVGHEKPLPPPWVVAKLTRPGGDVSESDFKPPIFLIERIDDPAGEPFGRRVDDARQALACGDLRTLGDAVEAPLTVSRFARNVLEAPRLWRLRVPAEPRDARSRYCGAADR
jgi:arabinofuranosyltransferase